MAHLVEYLDNTDKQKGEIKTFTILPLWENVCENSFSVLFPLCKNIVQVWKEYPSGALGAAKSQGIYSDKKSKL